MFSYKCETVGLWEIYPTFFHCLTIVLVRAVVFGFETISLVALLPVPRRNISPSIYVRLTRFPPDSIYVWFVTCVSVFCTVWVNLTSRFHVSICFVLYLVNLDTLLRFNTFVVFILLLVWTNVRGISICLTLFSLIYSFLLFSLYRLSFTLCIHIYFFC